MQYYTQRLQVLECNKCRVHLQCNRLSETHMQFHRHYYKSSAIAETAVQQMESPYATSY